ncbi:MAG: hypothetical protein EZS28_020073, partial [Streblomastix strix]
GIRIGKDVVSISNVSVQDIDLSSPFSHTCPKCHKFVSSSNRQGKRDQDGEFAGVDCSECGVEAQLSLRIPTQFIDQTGSISLFISGDTASSLVGYTAGQMAAFDKDKRDEIRCSLVWQRYCVEFNAVPPKAGPDRAQQDCSVRVFAKSLSKMPTTLFS